MDSNPDLFHRLEVLGGPKLSDFVGWATTESVGDLSVFTRIFKVVLVSISIYSTPSVSSPRENSVFLLTTSTEAGLHHPSEESVVGGGGPTRNYYFPC